VAVYLNAFNDMNDAVMECVDAKGRVIGFSIMGLASSKNPSRWKPIWSLPDLKNFSHSSSRPVFCTDAFDLWNPKLILR
jgi:hypothetical protein